MKAKTILFAAIAAFVALTTLSSCQKEYTGPFEFSIETPDNPSNDKLAFLLKGHVFAVCVTSGLTMPYDVTSELYIYDQEESAYVPAESIYDMPSGERMCLKRAYPCDLPGAPNGSYKAVVTLVRSNDGLTHTASKTFILNRTEAE